MKSFLTAGMLTSATLLAGCATPAVDPVAKDLAVAQAETFEDKGELITGSRIPQKSTTHTLRRVGSAEYKKSKMESGSNSMDDKAAKW